MKSPISGRFYARLILEKRALAKVLFLYFGLRNYSLIRDIIEPFFLNKVCLPHSQSLKLGNGAISKGTRSVLVNLCNFSSQFQYYAFHSISHKWTKLRTKTPKNLYFMFLLYPIGLQTHYRRTFFSWNKPNL